MTGKEGEPKKVINRSVLVAASEVLAQFNTEDNDSMTMGEMRQRVFEKLPREDMLKVRGYFNSPSDYIVNEEIGSVTEK